VAIQFAFQANCGVSSSLPNGDNVILCNGGTTIFTIGPSADPVADAVNNVRFTVTGSAPDGDFCGTLMTLRTTQCFQFHPKEQGRLTASTFFTPVLQYALTCAGEGFLWDKAGPVSINVFTLMSVQVRAQSGVLVLNSPGGTHNVFHDSLSGGVSARSRTGFFAPELMDLIETRSFQTIVEPSDTVVVRAKYVVQAFANDLATFLVDASSGGGGLNVPMAVIRTD
jgi:hypothetical protein